MHEFSLAESILTTVAGHLKNGQRLTRIFVTIGPLSGISAESLSFCFSELAIQKGLGSPELSITRSPAKMRCAKCATDYEVTSVFALCPACGALERSVLSGAEFTLDSMEVED